MNQLKAGQDKGGTGRAYLSTGSKRGDWDVNRDAIETRQYFAMIELARILGETERGLESGTLECWDGARCASGQLVAESAAPFYALAESLAAVTAPGGPLDSLAEDSQEVCSCDGECRGCFGGLLALDCPCDPVILAAQRDLAVLSAYAQQRA